MCFQKRFDEAKTEFNIGDIYVDAGNHACLCTEIDIEEKDVCLYGISLFDGSHPRSCSCLHSGPIKVSVNEAVKLKEKYEKHMASLRKKQ